jgi:diphosphomevalonate decarboxylase
MAGLQQYAEVSSENNFPSGAGIASSASAFAALAFAASHAAGLQLNEAQLSSLARRGSGSASRSVPGGFVEWQAQTEDGDSYAFSIAPPDHWDLVDCVAIVSAGHKKTGSTEGHALADTSPLQAARLGDTPRRLKLCRDAILSRDMEALAAVIELDSDIMHAVMMSSTPPLHYWQPASLGVMQEVRQWRAAGIPAAYTVDAGPNVHVICPAEHAGLVEQRLRRLPGVGDVLTASAGGPARLLPA